MTRVSDAAWLRETLMLVGRRAADDECVDFTERVGIKIDAGIGEDAARAQAYGEILEKQGDRY